MCGQNVTQVGPVKDILQRGEHPNPYRWSPAAGYEAGLESANLAIPNKRRNGQASLEVQ